MPCFPSLVLGWGYLLVLFGMLAAAAYTDLGWLVVPKKLSLTIAGLGILVNIFRGIMIGAVGQSVWILPPGPVLGAMDGLLFSLAGLFGGLLIIIPLLLMGAVGGGDAKLFPAMAAWTGIVAGFWVWVLATGVFVVLAMVRYLLVVANLGPKGLADVRRRPDNPERKPVPFKRLGAYSPALLVAAIIVLPWLCRETLGLQSSDSATTPTAQNHRLPAGESHGP